MDYGKGLALAGPPVALASTGANGTVWYVIAAVGLIGAGAAINRFVPRKQN